MTNTVRNPAIILVEDEPDILIILHRIMRDLTGGYDIVTVNSAQDALGVLTERSCPLLITDHEHARHDWNPADPSGQARLCRYEGDYYHGLCNP